MQRIFRAQLPARTQSYLDRRQCAIAGSTSLEREWKAARQTKAMSSVVDTLRKMAGARERCMYCVDSHGSDIEHFRPKTAFPDSAFEWNNMLLCCTECGRFKGDRFPLSDIGEPLLVDPSLEDPWRYLDFDPDTGNITARYDAARQASSPKGEATVSVLQLDRREGMTEGYRRTFRRIVSQVRLALAADSLDYEELANNLNQTDDHGILGWCFGPIGARLDPFNHLICGAPDAWAECFAARREQGLR